MSWIPNPTPHSINPTHESFSCELQESTGASILNEQIFLGNNVHCIRQWGKINASFLLVSVDFN